MMASNPHYDSQLGNTSLTAPTLGAGRIMGDVGRNGSEQARRRAKIGSRVMAFIFVGLPTLTYFLSWAFNWNGVR